MFLDYSYDVLRLLADVSVKAVLLWALVWVGVWIFRVRNDNVRHRLWTSVLVGMLLLPVLVGVTPRVPLPSWLCLELSPFATEERVGEEHLSSRMVVSSDRPSASMPGRADPSALSPHVPPGLTEPLPRTMNSDPANAGESSAHSDPTMTPGIVATPESGASPMFFCPVVVAAIYTLGLTVFLLRLLFGIGRVGAILGRARPVLLDRNARSTRVRICETPEVRVPMVAGGLRPCVLLPEDWSAWSDSMLASVLTHEEAHLARRDHWVALLAEINRCLYWFHPAAWHVRRELMRLAELSCDGAVIEATGDRPGYARHLLVVAGRLAARPGRFATCGVSMARRVNVETRIDAILDVRRPPARRLGVVGTVLLLAVMIPAVYVFAALGPAEGEGKTSSGTERSADGAKAKQTHTDDAGSSVASESAQRVTRIAGRVLDERGAPIRDAHVAVVGRRKGFYRGGDLESYKDEVLREVTTDAKGNFRMNIEGLSSESHWHPAIVAGADGHGLAWHSLNPDAEGVSVDLTLPKEQIIRGRLTDQQRRPASGIKMRVRGVVIRKSSDSPSDGVGYRRFNAEPAAWPHAVVSDAQGRFALRGVGAGYGVSLEVEGTDRFATQTMSLNTGEPEKRPENDGTYRPQVVRNLNDGEEFELRLAPTQIIEGVVRFEDTKRPAAHARVTVYARQEESSSMVGVAGRADAEGRFRINPRPGVHFYVKAYPPDGTPYLIRRKEFQWKPGDDKTQCDISLSRGVLIRGRIIEAKGKKPIAGASIQYIPESRNNPHTAGHIVTDWQGIELTDADGRFSIPVLPGPGRLLVHGPSSDYIFQVIGSHTLYEGLPGGMRHYAHAIERIEPEHSDEPDEMTIALNRGVTVEGRVVGPDGKPVERVLMVGRLEFTPTSTTWNSLPGEAWGGRFLLHGCAPGKKYPVYFLDSERRLGATAHVGASDAGTRPVVRLAPCGAAKVRYVDSKGKPYANKDAPSLRMVITPGPSFHFRRPGGNRSDLCADSDSVANVDRKNYWVGPKTDADGRVTLESLIPGATYRVIGSEKGRVVVKKDFTVEPGETVDLGEIVIDEEEGEVKSIAR